MIKENDYVPCLVKSVVEIWPSHLVPDIEKRGFINDQPSMCHRIIRYRGLVNPLVYSPSKVTIQI